MPSCRLRQPEVRRESECARHELRKDGEWMDPNRIPLRVDGTVRVVFKGQFESFELIGEDGVQSNKPIGEPNIVARCAASRFIAIILKRFRTSNGKMIIPDTTRSESNRSARRHT